MSDHVLEFENNLRAFFDDPERPKQAQKLALYCSVPFYLEPLLVDRLYDELDEDDNLDDDADPGDLQNDVLNAPFVRFVVGDYYRMDRNVREVLRNWLRDRYGADAEVEIARILSSYIEDQREQPGDAFWQTYLEAQNYAVEAILDPQNLARTVLKELSTQQLHAADRRRVVTKFAALAQEAEADFRRIGAGSLVDYARYQADVVRDRQTTVIPDDLRDGIELLGMSLPGLVEKPAEPQAKPDEPEDDQLDIVGRRVIITGHEMAVQRLAWSHDGQRLFSASKDATLRSWSLQSPNYPIDPHKTEFSFVEETEKRQRFQTISQVAWSPDNRLIAFATNRGVTVRRADTKANGEFDIVWQKNNLHPQKITCLCWSPDSQYIATGSKDSTIAIWHVQTQKVHLRFSLYSEVSSVAFSPDGGQIAAGTQASNENSVYIWRLREGSTPTVLVGHRDDITSLLWWRSERHGLVLASSSVDRTIRIWKVATNSTLFELSGHTAPVTRMSIAHNHTLLATAAQDKTIRFWNCQRDFALVSTLWRTSGDDAFSDVAFHPYEPLLVMVENKNNINITALSFDDLENTKMPRLYYSVAKVVVVGGGGIGKTTLTRRLADEPIDDLFAPQGIYISQMPVRTEIQPGKRMNREIILYDVAGQGDSQLVHQLYLDDVSVAVYAFNSNDDTSVPSLHRWDYILSNIQHSGQSAKRSMRKLLVQTRIDQMEPPSHDTEPNFLLQVFGADEYFMTSATTGQGIEKLRSAIINSIDWETIAEDVTETLFDDVRKFVESVKVEGNKLITTPALFHLFRNADLSESVTNLSNLKGHFEQCLHFLAVHQVIRQFSFGGYILLQPELLSIYATAIIAAARERSGSEFGSIEEAELLEKRLPAIDEQHRIRDAAEEDMMILMTVQELLRYEVALRDGGLLLFPLHFVSGKADPVDDMGIEFVQFAFRGSSTSIYAMLIVRLSRSGQFRRVQLGRHNAQFESDDGHTCNIVLEETPDSALLHVYCADDMPSLTRYKLDFFIYMHLNSQALRDSVKRQKVWYCENPDCPSEKRIRFPQEHVDALVKQGTKAAIACPICDEKTSLGESEYGAIRDQLQDQLQQMNRNADVERNRQVLETLYRLKEIVNVHDAYIDVHPQDQTDARELTDQLRQRGIRVLETANELERLPEQVRWVVVLMGDNFPTAPSETAALEALAERLKLYRKADLSVTIALHRIKHLPELVGSMTAETTTVFRFPESLDDADTLSQLAALITRSQ